MPDPNLSSFIWSVADLLRGDYKQSEYGRVIGALQHAACAELPQALGEKLAWYKANGILPHDKGGGPNGPLIIARDETNGSIDSGRIGQLLDELDL